MLFSSVLTLQDKSPSLEQRGVGVSINAKLLNRAIAKGIHYSLENVHDSLVQWDNPHHDLPPIIHVAGTNGKGSVVAFIESALLALGYTTGTYTSPHLISYCERYRFNGIPISESKLNHYYDKVKHLQTATEFELLTLMAWLYFKDNHPNYLIIETGLGGRLDATNVITPILSIITRIGLDHQAILGDTVQKIASEKAGIIKPKIPVITGIQKPEALQIIQKEATQKNSPLIVAKPVTEIPTQYTLQGHFQKENLGVAKAAITHLFGQEKLKEAEFGFETATNWGRYTIITPNHTHKIIIDAGHNEDGITATLETVKTMYPNRHLRIIVGFKQQKNAREMMSRLTEASHDICYCEFDSQWAMSYGVVCQLSNIPLPSISLATVLNFVIKHHPNTQEVTLITGSIYFIGKLKELLQIGYSIKTP